MGEKTALFQSKSVAFIQNHYFYPSSSPSAQDKTINWTNSQVGPAWASRFPSWECLESQFLPSPHPSRSRRRADHEHRWNGPIFSWWHWESTDGWLSSQKEWTSCVSRMLLRWYLLYISRSTLQTIIHLGLDIFGNIFTGNHRFLSIPSHPSRWSWPPCQPTDTYPRISFDHCRNPRFHYI